MALYQMVYYGPQVYKFHYDLDKFLKSRDLPIWTCMTNSRFTCTPTHHHFMMGIFFLREIKMTLQGTILFVTHDSKFIR